MKFPIIIEKDNGNWGAYTPADGINVRDTATQNLCGGLTAFRYDT